MRSWRATLPNKPFPLFCLGGKAGKLLNLTAVVHAAVHKSCCCNGSERGLNRNTCIWYVEVWELKLYFYPSAWGLKKKRKAMQFSLLRSIKYFVLNTHCCDCLFVVVPGIIVRVTRNPAGYYSVRTHMSYNVQQQQYLLPGNIIMPACPTRRIHENDNGTFVTRLCPYFMVYTGILCTGYSCSRYFYFYFPLPSDKLYCYSINILQQ